MTTKKFTIVATSDFETNFFTRQMCGWPGSSVKAKRVSLFKVISMVKKKVLPM